MTEPASTAPLPRPYHEELSSLRPLADQALSRAAGAPLVGGNRVRLLKNAMENYPAWLDAIAAAQHSIHFENYIIHSDSVGWQFAAALEAKARQGVRVRLLYDWLGALGKTSRHFWRSLRQAGVEVRCVNPPQLDSPLGWLSRDHRKVLTVDHRIGFVTGLCVGRMWTGDPARGIEPWRDTGVEVRGPAVADIEQAFADMWATTGEPIPDNEIPSREAMPAQGDVTLRVIASLPNLAGLYRLDQLVAAVARHSLWLADAYFIGTSAYVQALRAAALDGVDVRLLVPGSSDIPILQPVSRAGYRPLLEAGVRVFEWNGTMMHAKTAVADGRWARVGSTNLNLSSWIGNWELDLAIEHMPFAQAMEEMYLEDLTHATEIVLSPQRRVYPSGASVSNPSPHRPTGGSGSAGRAAAGVIRISNTVGAALINRRPLGPAEARIMVGAGVILLVLAIVVVLLPWVAWVPMVALAIWTAICLLVRAYHLWRRGRQQKSAFPHT